MVKRTTGRLYIILEESRLPHSFRLPRLKARVWNKRLDYVLVSTTTWSTSAPAALLSPQDLLRRQDINSSQDV